MDPSTIDTPLLLFGLVLFALSALCAMLICDNAGLRAQNSKLHKQIADGLPRVPTDRLTQFYKTFKN